MVDESRVSISLTLFGDKAADGLYDWSNHPIIAFKHVNVGDFGGKSLTSISNTSIHFSPVEGRALYYWKCR